MTYEYGWFNLEDFVCRETGENKIRIPFVLDLSDLREQCGFPFVVTSGYRSPRHSIERAKKSPGVHTQGIAADIRVQDGIQRRIIVHNALRMGFSGIGVADTFVHVDKRETAPVLWTY